MLRGVEIWPQIQFQDFLTWVKCRPWNLLHPEISLGNFVKNETQKWLLALVIFLGLICPKPLKKNNCGFICWELIWCRHLGTNQGHLLQPTCWLCHKPMQQRGWARGSWLKNSASLLQSTDHVAKFPIEKKGPEVPIGGAGGEGVSGKQGVLALLAYKCTKCLKRLLIGFLSPANQESSLVLISTNDLLFILYILLCNVSGVAHLGRVVNMLYAVCSLHKELHNLLARVLGIGCHFNRSSWYRTNKCGDLGVLGVVWYRFNLIQNEQKWSLEVMKVWKKTYEILFLLVYYFQCLWHTSYAGRLTQNGTEMEGRLRTKINSGCWEALKFCTSKKGAAIIFS
jgi:hypothetical protein